MKERKDVFIQSFLDFLQEFKLGSFLIISGVDTSNRTDSQMHTATFKLVPKQSIALTRSALSPLERLPTYSYASKPSYAETERDSGIPFIPGGGLTRRLLSTLPTAWTIPTACIVQFVMEGDNRADAHYLAGVVAGLLSLNNGPGEWKEPPSWQIGLFGTPLDQSLYG